MIYARRIASVLHSIWRASGERHFSLIAAGVAFYAFFAIFPAMAAIIAIWGLFADPEVVRSYLTLTRDVLPQDVYTILEGELASILNTGKRGIGWASAITLAVSFYAVHNGVAALAGGLNATGRQRSPGRGVPIFRTVGLTIVLVVIVLLALAAVVIVPVVVNFVPLGPLNGMILAVLPWGVTFVAGLMMLGLFYRWGPNMSRRPAWITPGAFLAAFLWAVASLGFSSYLANFGSYNRVYGSIGAIIALLMWLYISAYIILLGAAVNAEMDAGEDQ
ncbi:MAG: YihY/virulence factor BrkB family protein [Rhodobacteraceae bacterium]|nr:YihY/virulence factor BrkB family protein [Paracoccaceae bacterium]